MDSTTDDAGMDGAAPVGCTRPAPDEDADGDGLTNLEEASGEGECGRDTDGDALPDFLDGDSDGDGISDAFEALPRQVDGSPADSDGDGVPDFVDTDSDGNGLDDRADTHPNPEGLPGDLDGNGVEDFRDPDDDGDRYPDADELIDGRPVDSDGDGLPDHRDLDSDGDTILDLQEGQYGFDDWDGDGLPNRIDLDSDNDGIPDALEAGDSLLETPPFDIDGDYLADFLDLDSDDDTVPDAEESRRRLNWRDSDSDGDGAPDAAEVLLDTDGADPEDDPASAGIPFVVLPFGAPAMPGELLVSFTMPEDAAPVGRATVAPPERGSSLPVPEVIGSITPDVSSPGCAVRATAGGGDDAPAILDPAPGDQLCWRVAFGENTFQEQVASECARSRLGRQALQLLLDGEPGPVVVMRAYIPPTRELPRPDAVDR
ncbi:MAG: hypothetical protein AAF447_09380 [Myxococcota bacterium]